jgi:hypothetical protein
VGGGGATRRDKKKEEREKSKRKERKRRKHIMIRTKSFLIIASYVVGRDENEENWRGGDSGAAK